MSIILAGDFWQLPPVGTNAIFSNPCKKGCYSAEEQRILNMFWHPEDKDSIQETYMLTKPMRTKDKWLQTTLDASREGRESWEMYCVTHGFPTRNPGTWFPRAAAPECGNPTCAKLATEIWPQMWERGQCARENWLLRLEKECEQCADERKRRCCVLREGHEADAQRYISDPFAAAPFVHPFRHPSYHATQLRAIVFAKSKQK